MKYTITITSLLFCMMLLFSMTALATECPESIPQAMPAMPDGATATEAGMFEAQQDMRAYVNDIVSFVECRAPVLRDSVHNMLVDQAEAGAGSYNRELRRYLERQALLAQS